MATIGKRRSRRNGKFQLCWSDGCSINLTQSDSVVFNAKNEPRWCMACAGTCRTGSNLKVRDCKQKSSADATFVVKGFNAPNSGYQYRIAKTNLCLQTNLPNITLSPCKINEPRQLFTSKPSAKFDIRPIKSKDRCLTQHHHPRADELIYAEHCSIAHMTTTGYWTAY